MENEPFILAEVETDGTRKVIVRGVEFRLSPQALPDDEWAAKIQAKANAWGQMLAAQQAPE